MTTTFRMKYRALVKSLVVCLIFSQVILPASAASTDIANLPMAVKNTVLPNVMFTLDDSGSMQGEILPEPSQPYLVFPRPTTVYGTLYGYSDATAMFDLNNKYARYYRTAKFNRMYYDPTIKYEPWTNADGTLMPPASPSGAFHNPYNSSEGSRVLNAANTETVLWMKDDGTSSSESLTFWPATYFTTTLSTLTGPDDLNNLSAQFTQVEINPATTSYTKASSRTDCAAATCTYAEEIQNFANWYTYYRSRILAARAGIGKAFSKYDNNMRVGFGAINKGSTSVDDINTGTIKIGVRPFTGTGRTTFYDNLYGHPMPSSGTPLRKAMDDVGQYFSRTDDKGPWGKTPGSTGGTQYACRQNYHILMTDGYWNGDAAATSNAKLNVDNTAGSTLTKPAGATAPPSFTYSPGNPYSDSHSNTLADVAMYYWVNDLRTDLDNIAPANSKDPAFWQHMVNFTVGLGVTGTVSASNIAAAFTTTPPTITWPDPASSNANKIDDLAHAAINSRGGFFSASDPATFSTALSDSLNDIVGRSGAAAAVAVANANPTTGDNASYSSKYDSGTWTGDLAAFPINLTTGVPDENNPIWGSTAQTQLDARTSADRFIVTYSGTGGVQFQPTSAATTTKLVAAQQALLNSPSATDGAAVLAYLRGDKSQEGTVYRARTHLLGDIVNAEAVIVRNPLVSYADVGFSAFKTAQASRTKVIFQGANDGMLHAFDAGTGAEKWAYIPKLVFANLNGLTKKTGFAHQYFVDSTPAVTDVDFKQTNGATGSGTDWRTILVGGLGKGGRGYYALDVTNPVPASEADAAAKVLWEFPNDGNKDTHIGNTSTPTYSQIMGYSFGKPIVVKTAAEGWVVLIPSGYNNATGQGYLIVLNARTGAVIKVIDTPSAGTADNPSGLAHISGYVENSDVDNTVDYVYGGDLLGNVWRFDLTAANTNSWSVVKLATLVDAAGTAQPVTTAPDLAKIDIGNFTFKRMVYVGTGQYLGDSDVPGTVGAKASATQTQTMYALVDDQTNTPLISPLRANLQEQTFTTAGDGLTRTVSSTEFSYAGGSAKKGWYIDLPVTGERINTDPAIGIGVLTFVTNIPGDDPCEPGGSSWVNSVDYRTGGFVVSPGITHSSTYLGKVLGSRVVLIKLESGSVKGLIRKSDANTETTEIPGTPPSGSMKRVSWRELADQ